MGDTGEEPPDDRRQQEISKLVTIVQDKKSILLLPNKSQGEKAVCNPAVWENHFIYRVRIRAYNDYKEKSIVKYRELITPYQLSEKSITILEPEFEYEKDGIEDARVSKNGQYNIIYTAFNEDKKDGGAKVALATLDDFKKPNEIIKHGIIGPQIRLREGIQFAGGPNSYYGAIFDRELRASSEANPFIMDKDATIVYAKSGQQIFLHRIGDSIQATPFNSIEELQTKEFWRETFGKLEQQTILHPGKIWAPEKVGLGGTPIAVQDEEGNKRIIGHIHGVEKKESENLVEYTYKSTFVEFDPETYHIKAIVRDPILLPDSKYIFEEKNGKTTIKKYINFATGITTDLKNDSVVSYSGVGDYGIRLRTNELKDWLLKELAHKYNKIEKWQRII